jgi:S1-C subfamily serine protease
MMTIIRMFVVCLVSFLWICSVSAQDPAEQLYKKYEDRVFQVQVIDLGTDKKTAIGSGFCFSPEGHIATNYHVISRAVMSPEKFRVEYLTARGQTGVLKILAFDVIHDLAVLKADDMLEEFLPLGHSDLANGAKIYSLGNPHDLGMTIVDGIYNGLMEQSMYQKILFSGSLNSGMSGGPALNAKGWVIGVNVATAGNQISFLVPVEFLISLYDDVLANRIPDQSQWIAVINDQLRANQAVIADKLTESDWDQKSIGFVTVPAEMHPSVKCWGETQEPRDTVVHESSFLQCATDDWIYVDDALRTGRIFYN